MQQLNEGIERETIAEGKEVRRQLQVKAVDDIPLHL